MEKRAILEFCKVICDPIKIRITTPNTAVKIKQIRVIIPIFLGSSPICVGEELGAKKKNTPISAGIITDECRDNQRVRAFAAY
jgi:hypothetical protein